jgi:hypothetical protein
MSGVIIVRDKKVNMKMGLQCYKCKGWEHLKRNCQGPKKDGGPISVVIANRKDD